MLATGIGLGYIVWTNRGNRMAPTVPAKKCPPVVSVKIQTNFCAKSALAEKALLSTPTNAIKRYGHSSNVPSADPSRIHKATMNGMTVIGWDGKERVIKSNPIFESRVDNMLWAAIRPGGMPSGLNALRARMRHQTGSDAAFLEALRRQDFTIESDDPPYVQVAKEATKEIKDRITAELGKGRTFDELYQEICETTRKERMYERIAQEDMRNMIKTGDAEAIREYVRNMNPILESMGLKTLRVPSWAEER